MSDEESMVMSPSKESGSKERYSELVLDLPVIAKPLAPRRTVKHVLKLVKKGLSSLLFLFFSTYSFYSIQGKICKTRC